MPTIWSELDTLAKLERRMAKYAPDNCAEVPISAAKTMTEDGDWAWVVDIHVRVLGWTEYEVSGVGKTFAAALRRAYLGLNNENNLVVHADHANRAFHLINVHL